MAVERIKLFEADIDVDGIIKKSSELKSEIASLKERQKELKDSGDTVSETYVKLEARLKNVSREFGINQQQLSNMTTASGGTVTITQKLAASLDKEVKSIQGAVDNNKELRKIRNSVNAETEAGQKAIADINKKIDENTAFIKENTDSYSRQKMEIGNYKGAITEALDQTGLFGGELGKVKDYLNIFKAVLKTAGDQAKEATDQIRDAAAGTEGLGKAQKMGIITTQSLSGALKLLKVALISTGIGAIVVLLGSLVAYLSTTQAGIDKVTSVTRPLQTVFQTLMGVFQKIGEYTFNNPLEGVTKLYNFVKDQVIRTFQSWWDIVSGIATLDFEKAGKGIQALKDQADENAESLKNFGKEIGGVFKEAWERGQEIDKLQKQLSKGEAEFITLQSQLKQELKEQNLIAEDQTKTLAEREAAAKRTIDISREINGQQTERLKLEQQILELKSKSNDTSDADLVELAELNKAIAESKAQQLEMETTQNNKLNGIRKEAHAKASAADQKALDDAAKKMKLELDLYLQNEGEKNKSLEQELKHLEAFRDKKLAIAQAEFEASKKTENDKLELQRAQNEIKKEFLEQTTQASIDNANAELALWIETNQSKINSDTEITEAIIAEENKRLEYIKDNSLKILEAELATSQAIIDQKRAHNEELSLVDLEYLTQKAALENEYTQQILTNEKSLKDAAKAKEAEDLSLENELKMAEAETKYEEDLVNEDIRYQAELAKLIERKEADLITEAQYNLLAEEEKKRHTAIVKGLDQGVVDNKMELASMALNYISAIVGKETALGKAVAVAQATMDTYKSAVAAYAAGLSIGGPAGLIAGPVMAGLAVAAGLVNIKKITSTKAPKAERGISMDIGGERHAQGGTTFYDGHGNPQFEAEKGEKMFILNRRASAALGPLLSGINQKYGGISLSQSSSYLARGGQVYRNPSTSQQPHFDTESIGEIIGNKVLEGSRQGSREGSSSGTYSGIVDKETNEIIAAGANF